jgi:hypothetical protein
LRSLLMTAQSALEAYLKLLRNRWILCRYRHKIHYSDVPVMPTSQLSVLPLRVLGLVMSA